MHIGKGQPSLPDRSPDDGNDGAEVLPRRKFRDNTAVLTMGVKLRCYY
jgi:hypothetical protein